MGLANRGELMVLKKEVENLERRNKGLENHAVMLSGIIDGLKEKIKILTKEAEQSIKKGERIKELEKEVESRSHVITGLQARLKELTTPKKAAPAPVVKKAVKKVVKKAVKKTVEKAP